MRIITALIALLFIAAPALADPAPEKDGVPRWNVVFTDSTLGFAGVQMQKPFEGSFGTFRPDIYFDAAKLDKSSIHVEVDTASFSSGDADRDKAAVGTEWFDSKTFPVATFDSTEIKKIDDTHFEVYGNLKVKETAIPLVMPFTLNITKIDDKLRRAVAEGIVTVDRAKLGLGKGEWADPGVIAPEVKISFRITAHGK